MKTRLFLATMLFASAACSSAGSGDPTPTCGDGDRSNVEQCDDGNLVDGDGCSKTCTMESSGAKCGDGAVANGEQCDDGNVASGDGCSAICEMEQAAGGTCGSPYTLMPMANAMGQLEAQGTGDTKLSTDQIAEALCDGFDSGAAADHVWKFTLTVASDVVVMTDEATEFDSVLRVMTAPCDVTTEISEYGDEDGCSDGEGAAELLGYVRLAPGTYYVAVDGYTAQDVGAYSFTFLAWPTTCGDGVVDPLEFCDDGNDGASDGCSAKCEVEDGYVCDDAEPSVCSNEPAGAVKPKAGDLVLNEFMAADNTSDTNCDGSTTNTVDEFVELVNVSTKTLDLEGVTVADSVVMRHTFSAGTTLPPNQAIVVWGGGAPACAGVTRFEIASSGQLGLNDSGDTIVVADDAGAQLLSTTFGAATVNVSNNLAPEITGTSYMLHNAMTGAMGAYSPGKRSNGAAF